MAMEGFIVGLIKLKTGTRWYNENVYIAQIEHDKLLGFDILFHRVKSALNMAKGTLTFDDQEITLDMGSQGGTPFVARVIIAKDR